MTRETLYNYGGGLVSANVFASLKGKTACFSHFEANMFEIKEKGKEKIGRPNLVVEDKCTFSPSLSKQLPKSYAEDEALATNLYGNSALQCTFGGDSGDKTSQSLYLSGSQKNAAFVKPCLCPAKTRGLVTKTAKNVF